MNEHLPFFTKLRKKIDKKRSLIVAAILITCATALYITITYVDKKYQPGTSQIVHVPEVIQGKIITLKTLKEEYFIDYHNMFSNEVRKNLEFPEHITLSYTISYLREELKKSQEGKQLLYMIFDNKDNKLIGGIEIRELNDEDPGQLGMWVNEHYWGGGRLQEALNLISKTYFTLNPQEEKYNAHVRLWNKRSYHALKKYGFKEVGYFYENNEPVRHILEITREQVLKK